MTRTVELNLSAADDTEVKSEISPSNTMENLDEESAGSEMPKDDKSDPCDL